MLRIRTANARPRRFCSGCGRERGPTEYACPLCGDHLYGATVPGTASGAQLLGPVRGVLAGLIELPPTFTGILYGPKGGGKTTIGLAALTDPWVVSSEMAPALVAAYARRIGVKLSRVSVPEYGQDADGRPIVDLQIARNYSGDVLFDSLTTAGDPALALLALRQYCRERNARGLAIVQLTKDGSMRGPASLGHDTDVVVCVERGRVTVEKHRFGPEGSRTFEMRGDGARLPTWDRYYSVEGEGPDYRLVSWPSSGRYAAPFKLGPDLGIEPPPPPLATACERAEVYRGRKGWIEPHDIEARIAFCARHGIPFWSPTREKVNHGNDDGS